MKKKYPYILLVLFVLLAIALVYFSFSSGSDRINKIISLIGTAASLSGILVTVFQVSFAVEKTEQVREEVKKNNDDLRAFQSFASFSQEAEIVKSIISDIPLKEYCALQRRLSELKSFLNRQKESSLIMGHSNWKNQIDTVVVNLGMDIQNLTSKISNINLALDIESISKHLSQANDLLDAICGQMEQKKYE